VPAVSPLITLGELIGEGQFRQVFAIRGHSDLVAKVEKSGASNNLSEWAIWLSLPAALKSRYAPAQGLLDEGRILIMQRTQPVRPEVFTRLPESTPDNHHANFGWLRGQIVCHDYAFALDHKSVLTY
jgi:hypothetical protein